MLKRLPIFLALLSASAPLSAQVRSRMVNGVRFAIEAGNSKLDQADRWSPSDAKRTSVRAT
jgi:hypothetical protein